MIHPGDNFLETFSKIDFEKVRSHPNILIAANFWDQERFMAAKACYRFMRAIDDMIDDHKAKNKKITPGEQEIFHAGVQQWISNISQGKNPDFIREDFTGIIERFRIPQWPFDAFAKSMIYDIYHDGFPTVDSFLEYSQGASVAPAAIFVHLCGLTKNNNSFNASLFDVRTAAAPCAIFSYLVHIIRDFQKDQLNNLNYFADESIVKHGLSKEELRKMAGDGCVNDSFRSMVLEYYSLADEYRIKTNDMIRQIIPFLEPDSQLSLSIIFNLYLMVFERIDCRKGCFTQAELEPTAAEIKERVYKTILEFQPYRISENHYHTN
jgi:phytoene/squalene synthetase